MRVPTLLAVAGQFASAPARSVGGAEAPEPADAIGEDRQLTLITLPEV